MTTNITAEDSWTPAILAPSRTMRIMLFIRPHNGAGGSWANGTTVILQAVPLSETFDSVTSAFESAEFDASGGGIYSVPVAGSMKWRAGVKAGSFGAGDNIDVVIFAV